MRTKHFFLAACTMMLCAVASAADVVVDGITYSLNTETREASLTKGAKRETVIIPDSIEYEGVKYPVTSIERFSGPNTMVAFKNLLAVTIGRNVRRIGENAFNNCFAMKEINIPAALQSIGSDAFSRCSSLEKVEIADFRAWFDVKLGNRYSNPIQYASELYTDGKEVTELVIPEGVTHLSSWMFYKCKHITSLSIPASLDTIPNNAFEGCESLSQVSFADSSALKAIGENAFASCSSLSQVSFANLSALKAIGEYAFASCSSLSQVNFLDSTGLETIGQYAFAYCDSLRSIQLPKGLIKIGDDAFATCTNLRSVRLPDGLAEIGIGAFLGCSSLESIDIPTSVISIQGNAFYGCYSLRKIDLPESVKSVGPGTFGRSPLDTLIIRGWLDEESVTADFFYGMDTSTKVFVRPSEMGRYKKVYKGPVLSLALLMPDDPAIQEEKEDSVYHLFVVDDKWWSVARSAIDGTISGVEYRFDSKSVVGEHTYFTLQKWENNQWTTVGLFREENKQVFLYDEASGREYKTYDFSLKQGDTFRMEYPVPMQCEVVKAEYTGVDGVSLYSLKIKAVPDGSEESVELEWTEYIGNQESPLAGLYPERPTDGSVSCVIYAYGDGIYLPFEVNIPMWHGKEFVFGEKVNAEDVGLKFSENKLNYELIPERGSNTYTLHVTGYMWVDCGSYTYVMCIEKATENENERKIAAWNNTFGPYLAYCKYPYKVNLRFRGFDPDVRYIYEDEEGEHEVLRTDMARHFIEEGKVWRVQDYEWTTGSTDCTPVLGCEEFHYFDGDTVVGDQLCKKWMIRMDDHGLGIADQDMPNPMYAAAVYEEAGRVFIALPGEDRFRTLYDFTAKTGDSIDVYWKHHSHTDGGSGVSCIVGARRASESPVFKGLCTDILCRKANDPQSETPNALWMSGVGSVGIYNLEDGFWSRDHTLISCTVGDEVLYYDEALADSLYGTGDPEAKKNRLDFTHVVKSQPKAQHKAPGEAGDEALTGTYSQYSLYVSFLPLQGAYTVTLTDADGNVVYTKDVLTDNVLALNADLAQYPEGDYSLRVENDSESYTAAFTLIGTNDISSLPSSPRGGDVLYDLQGRKILSPLPRNGETLPKGIYIRNGKKVLVK